MILKQARTLVTPRGHTGDSRSHTDEAAAPASDITITNNDVNSQDSTTFPLAAIFAAADSQNGQSHAV